MWFVLVSTLLQFWDSEQDPEYKIHLYPAMFLQQEGFTVALQESVIGV